MKQQSAQEAVLPAKVMGFAPMQWLKTKKISYFALPLIVMATVAEVFILVTGWRYQQVACLPKGMGVTFLGIGPIGATILAVELLKLPLAIWTASRRGWQKGFMLVIGLPLICLLTFQLVKDMAVYEMGVAMQPATEFLEKAATEESKIAQLNNELAGVEQKKVEIERKRAELATRQAKAKADIEESLKRVNESREDAISLTDYQKNELSEVESRQAAIIRQFDADSERIAKSIAELRAQREIEVARAAKWNAEEARIENQYKIKMAEYANKKAAYQKAKTEYDNAIPLKRLLMPEPVDPGVPPVRESNTILKPVEIAEIDAQIKAKEAELLEVNNKRRERVAQVDADARRVREEFARRSATKREEVDRKREELLAAQAALVAQWVAEEKQLDQELSATVHKVDGIQTELDATRAKAERFYEAREDAIKNTQVHRIATTVEIVRGLLLGQRPVSIQASAKERGDIYTDQIAMVRIWVYPVLAFIVAFLPMLMVEVGFSTIFQPETQRPPHRLGFLGRGMHALYKRAGRLKILRAERLAKEAAGALASCQRDLIASRLNAEQLLAQKESELAAVRQTAAQAEADQEALLKQKENEWMAKYTELADSLNRAVLEKDSLRDMQRSEIERQVQLRQKAWSDRVTQLRQELDDQRAASEAERAALMQEHHEKLMAVTEDCKAQVSQARRQVADAELAAVEKNGKLLHDLQEAIRARDAAEAQLRHQAESFAAQLAQVKDEAALARDTAVREEKLRQERQQADYERALRQREEESNRRLKQRERELSAAFESRLDEEKAKMDQFVRRREAELEQQAEARLHEAEARWSQDAQQSLEAAETRFKQREQQLLAQAEARVSDAQNLAEQELRRRQLELERQIDAQRRDAEMQLRQELQQKELAAHARIKQREQELTAQATAREAEWQARFAADLRARDEQWQRQLEARVHAVESKFADETQQREEMAQIKWRQREQQLQSQFDAREAELKAQYDQNLRTREQEWERTAEARLRAADTRLLAELQQREEQFQTKLRQRDEQWQTKLDGLRAELAVQFEQELRRREMESAAARERALGELEAQLRKEMQTRHDAIRAEARAHEQEMAAQLATTTQSLQAAEKERDEAQQIAGEYARQLQEWEGKLAEVSSVLTGWPEGIKDRANRVSEMLIGRTR